MNLTLKPIPVFRIVTILALALLAGLGLGVIGNFSWEQNWPILSIFLFGLIFSAFINFLFKNYLLTIISWVAVFFVIGFGYSTLFASNCQINWPFGEKIDFTGRIVEQPAVSGNGQRLIIKIENITADSIIDSSGKLILAKGTQYGEYQFGDLVHIVGKVEKPFQTPDFDYGRYLKKYPVYGVVNVPEKVEVIGHASSMVNKILVNLYAFSNQMGELLARLLPEPQAGLAAGILLGQKANLPTDFSDNLARVGLTHLVALSGYNVTIIAVNLLSLLRSFFGKRKHFLFSLTLIVLFVVMTGAAASIVRAAIFTLILLFGGIFGRKADYPNIVLLTAIIMATNNPFMLVYDLGFQLSFAAFLGLIYISPLIKNWIENRKPFSFLGDAKTILAETAGAQLAVLPLITTTFGTLSIVSLLSNVAVLWIVPAVMLLTFMTLICGFISIYLGQIAADLLWPLLTYIIVAVNFFGRFSWAALKIPAVPAVYMIPSYFVLIAMIIFWQRRSSENRY